MIKLNNIFRIGKAENTRWILMALTALITIGFASYMSPYKNLSDEKDKHGSYYLSSVLEGKTTMLEGPVFYEIAEQHSGTRKTPVFKLHFLNANLNSRHDLGFIIPLTQQQIIKQDDVFTVASEIDGFINKFESVFGYANFEDKKASLYFTDNGSIKIMKITDAGINGQMNMVLKDSRGKSLELRGNFNALPLPQYQ